MLLNFPGRSPLLLDNPLGNQTPEGWSTALCPCQGPLQGRCQCSVWPASKTRGTLTRQTSWNNGISGKDLTKRETFIFRLCSGYPCPSLSLQSIHQQFQGFQLSSAPFLLSVALRGRYRCLFSHHLPWQGCLMHLLAAACGAGAGDGIQHASR